LTAVASPEAMRAGRGFPAAMVFAYTVAAAAIGLLVHFGGVWNVLANSRLLDVLSRGGIVALTDADQGIVQGIPDPELYLLASQPIDWELVVVAAALFTLVWVLKAAQFHGICRLVGVEGTLGSHAKAWYYGHGANRLLPFDAGKVGTATTLEGQGVPRDRAAQAIFVGSLFTVAEVAAVGILALWFVGFGTFTSMLVWALVILAVAYVMVRPERHEAVAQRRATLAAAGQAVRALARQPAKLGWLFLLGVGSILLVDAACYALSQGFTTTIVIMNVSGDVMLMAVVAGYVARLIPFTPGGLGQWEWGFAAALYVGGLGFPEAATIALLVTALRYLVGGLILLVVTAGYGVPTNLGRVLSTFTGREALR
jgi:hypothetical protein